MKTSYFKSYLLVLFLSCCCTNNTFALPFATVEHKLEVNASEAAKDIDEKVQFKIELEIVGFLGDYRQLFLLNVNQFESVTIKLKLPSSYHSLPELPPKF